MYTSDHIWIIVIYALNHEPLVTLKYRCDGTVRHLQCLHNLRDCSISIQVILSRILNRKVILWYRENAFQKERLGAAIDRVGLEAFEKALEGDDLLRRKEEIIAADLKVRG